MGEVKYSGPVEQQLKEHESELTNLKKSIQQLTEAHETFACKTGAMFDGIRTDVTSFVQQALAQRETRTQSRFDEIKEMLQVAAPSSMVRVFRVAAPSQRSCRGSPRWPPAA